MKLAGLLLSALILMSCKGPVDAKGQPVTVARLRLRTFPMGAKVWINGELKVDATPATLILPAGEYKLRMQLPPAEPYEITVSLAAGDNFDRTYNIPAPADATVTVISDVEGAGVRINGWPRGYTPLREAVTRAGRLDITLTHPDGRAKSFEGHLMPAEQKTVEVIFGPAPPKEEELPAPPVVVPEGTLTIGALPNADVFWPDGTLLGKTPIMERKAPAGVYTITLRTADGKKEKVVRIEVIADKSQTYRFALDDVKK